MEGWSKNSAKYVECDKCFKDKKKLKEHTDKMRVRFECDECEKSFRCEAFLEKHNEENCRMLNCSTTTIKMASVTQYKHYIHTFMKI